MQDTMERQEQGTRALARTGGERDGLSPIDLDDTPVYASTSIRRIPMGKSGKYWIEIQEELDFGQQTILDNASVIGVQREQANEGSEPGQTVRLDLTRQRFLLCATWMTRWSLPPDANGKDIRLPRHINDRIEVLKRLNPAWGDAIVAAITEHVAARQAEEEAAQTAADEEAGIDVEAREVDQDDIPPERGRLNGESTGGSTSYVGEPSVVASS